MATCLVIVISGLLLEHVVPDPSYVSYLISNLLTRDEFETRDDLTRDELETRDDLTRDELKTRDQLDLIRIS